jgi:hypothetical protein
MPRDFEKSRLLEVLPVRLEDLSIQFLTYDTIFTDSDGEDNYYNLPSKGDYMILLLRAGSGQRDIWTTIRSQWGKSGNKLEYYRGAIGEIFECKIL